VVTQSQLAVLDPTGARTRLFAPTNPERPQCGDILLIRLRTGDPVSGVIMSIRQRHSPIDTAVLLRNQLTRVGVEVWWKIYSPNVEGIEVVQRAAKRARRANLYYLRQPRHDVGSVEGVVSQYLRQRAGGPMGAGQKGGQGGGNRKKGKKGKR
jgi:large subunit ribosomal protein L19